MTSVRRLGCIVAYALMIGAFAAQARADEIWVAPTAQQDLGGLGIASNVFWPASALGAVRLAWSVPDNLKTLQSAKVVLIPQSPGASSLNVFVCSSKNGDMASGNCTGPSSKPFTAVPNTLMEVEIAGILAPYIGSPGASYLAVIAYTTPTTATDHIVGLRFGYEPTKVSGVPTLAANTFSGTQTAPAFVGNGSGLTGLPFPSGAATLGANTFTGTQTAPAFAGSGASLTGVAKLAANTFTGTQTIFAGNLELGQTFGATSGNITKEGELFLHDFGNQNTFLGRRAGSLGLGGVRNTGTGVDSLKSVTTGESNTANGARALSSNTSGESNTAIGDIAMALNTTGFSNTAIGGSALFAIQEGHDNVAVGTRAGAFALGSNNIYLGALVEGLAGESNTITSAKLAPRPERSSRACAASRPASRTRSRWSSTRTASLGLCRRPSVSRKTSATWPMSAAG